MAPRHINVGNLYDRPTECRWPRCRAEEVGDGIPLCRDHFVKVGIAYVMQNGIASAGLVRAPSAAETHLRQKQDLARRQQMDEQSVVYYIRIGDHVKIGYTTNLHQRMGALRVRPADLLATEPGGRMLEADRHAEFAAERVSRREDFNPSSRLLAHIESVRKEHGEPVITSRRSGAA